MTPAHIAHEDVARRSPSIIAGRLIRRALRRIAPAPLRRVALSVAHYPDTRKLAADWTSLRELHRLEHPSDRLLASKRMVQVRFRALNGVPVKLRPGTQDDGLAHDAFFKAHHLPPSSLEAKDLRVIWDLGANVGLTMAHMASLFPGARIVGVELDEDNVRLCRENIAVWGARCEIIHAAVWVADGTVAYERRAGHEQSFHVAEDVVSPAAEGTRAPASLHAATTTLHSQAPAMSLNTLLARTAAEQIDYVKMDIEGAEARVLKEHAEWAERVRSIKVEVHAPYGVAECSDDLQRLGFEPQPLAKRRGGVLGIRRA